MEPDLLCTFAWISLAIAFASAAFIAVHEMQEPQKMAIMNVVWPVSALYFSIFAVWAYLRWGLQKTRKAMAEAEHSGQSQHSNSRPEPPSFRQIAVGTSHCGAGCTIADIVCEFAIAAGGLTILGSALWAEFPIDFIGAWALGIVFQYFTIKPMRDLSVGQGIVAAIKADTLSILAFQVGMYAWMTLVYFVLFPDPHLTPFSPCYWLMMQIGMICGFATSFPMNRFLLRAGLKEAM